MTQSPSPIVDEVAASKEHREVIADRDWWQQAGDVLGLKLFGFTYRAVGAFRDPADHDATVNLTGKVAERLISLVSPPKGGLKIDREVLRRQIERDPEEGEIGVGFELADPEGMERLAMAALPAWARDEILRLRALVSPPKAGTGEPVGYVTQETVDELGAGRIGGYIFPAKTLSPEYEVPLYANPEPRGDGVRVKPLEWVHIPSLDVWSANGGIYWAWERNGVGYWRRWHPQDNENHQVDGDGEAAEAAAQAHFEAEIRKHLLPPVGDSRAEIVEALEAARDLAKTMEGLTGCRSDDDYVWSAQAKIEAALASIEQEETKP